MRVSVALISVVVPTCHRNEMLAQCLDRLAPGAQSLPPDQYEVIVTDDGRQTTAERMVVERYPWVRWAAGPRRGPAANRNGGARQARGAWVAFTDDDCLPEPDWLASLAAAVRPGADVYEGKTICKLGIKSPLMHAPVNYQGGCLWSCNFMIRASVFERLGGFDEDFAAPAMEDADLRERLKTAGYGLTFVETAVVDHPPRPMARGAKMAKMYESSVQFQCKHRGAQTGPRILFVRLLLFRLRTIKHLPFSLDTLRALGSLVIELAYVAGHLKQWQKKYRDKYAVAKTRSAEEYAAEAF